MSIETQRIIRGSRALRLSILALAVLAVLWAASVRPDYLDPTQLGTDVSTYRGAGERLVSGGKLYELAPGDRPQYIWPPYWSAALVSPPTMGALWAFGALLPAAPAMIAWWLGAMAITLGVVAIVILRGPLLAGLVAIPLLLAIAITSWTGNVNGYLLGLAAVTWACGTRPGRTGAALAGTAVALAAGVKIGPVLFLVWLLGQRRWGALAGAVVAGMTLLLVTIVFAGTSAFSDYIDVARSASAAAGSGWGAAGVARLIGFSESVAQWAPEAFAVVCAIAILALRHRPRVSFAFAAAGAVLALPVVRYESLTLLLAAFLPWSLDGSSRSFPAVPRPPRTTVAIWAGALAALVGVGAIGFSTARTSGLWITNVGSARVVVRVYFNGIPESFGFSVPPGVTARAWGPTTGSVAGPLVVYSAGCQKLSVSEVPATGGLLTVRADGSQVLAPDSGSATSAALAFDAACAEQAP